MNSRLLPVARPGATSAPDWPQQIAAWRRLIAECARKPSRRCVHALRVATLRLQAELEFRLSATAPEELLVRAAERWNKQAKKLRRALTPAREADVYQAKLAALRDANSGPGEYKPRSGRTSLRQIGVLQSQFKKQRRDAEKDLTTELEARRPRLNRMALALEKALAQSPSESLKPTVLPAVLQIPKLLFGLTSEFPTLNKENLHAYRKRVKKLRYLVEVAAAADTDARRLAATLKGMQAAVGEWHDWQVLAQKARHTFRDKSREGGLVELLDTLAEEWLQQALAHCRRATARLADQAADAVTPRPGPAKLPVRSHARATFAGQSRYA